MKKRFGKIFISSGLAVMMFIASFLRVYHVNAAGSTNLFTVYSFNRGSSRTYMYEDIYLVSGDLLRGYVLTIIVNDNFRNDSPNSLPYTSGVIECDGDYDIQESIASSGSGTSERRKYTYTITLNDVSYFHFQVVNYGTNNFWDANAGSPGYWMAVTIRQPSSYQVSSKKSIYSYLAQILTAIQNGGSGGTVIDLSGIESQLNDLIDLMDLNLAYDMSIDQKLDLLLDQISIQSGSQNQESIDNNDNKTNDLNDISGQYNELESDFNSDFNNNLDLIDPGSLSDQLDSWTNSVTWYRTQMDNIFNGLGQFQFIATLALLLSLALIFIGR